MRLKHIRTTFVLAFAAAVRAMAAITTAALLKRRCSCSPAKHMSVALLLVSGVIALEGSTASAGGDGVGLGTIGSIVVVENPPTDPCEPAPRIVNFDASSSAVDLGASTTLNWSVQVPAGVPIG
jgi:hypothetical protein